MVKRLWHRDYQAPPPRQSGIHLGNAGSVFECDIDPALWTALRARLLDTIDYETDSLRFYMLGRDWRRRVEHIGAKPSTDPDGLMIV